MKTHKRKKRSRLRGSKTAFWGARKKHKKSGQRGGKGMAGTGKRADQKKTLILKLYGNKYFGKQGITSKGTKPDKEDRINLKSINNIEGFIKSGLAKKSGDKYELNLENYKILGDGDVDKKIIIKARAASESAKEKVKRAGGDIILE
ncbi:MAG: uL15 family ribosomal protein [Nanoarchaeota archaeon]